MTAFSTFHSLPVAAPRHPADPGAVGHGRPLDARWRTPRCWRPTCPTRGCSVFERLGSLPPARPRVGSRRRDRRLLRCRRTTPPARSWRSARTVESRRTWPRFVQAAPRSAHPAHVHRRPRTPPLIRVQNGERVTWPRPSPPRGDEPSTASSGGWQPAVRSATSSPDFQVGRPAAAACEGRRRPRRWSGLRSWGLHLVGLPSHVPTCASCERQLGEVQREVLALRRELAEDRTRARREELDDEPASDPAMDARRAASSAKSSAPSCARGRGSSSSPAGRRRR